MCQPCTVLSGQPAALPLVWSTSVLPSSRHCEPCHPIRHLDNSSGPLGPLRSSGATPAPPSQSLGSIQSHLFETKTGSVTPRHGLCLLLSFSLCAFSFFRSQFRRLMPILPFEMRSPVPHLHPFCSFMTLIRTYSCVFISVPLMSFPASSPEFPGGQEARSQEGVGSSGHSVAICCVNKQMNLNEYTTPGSRAWICLTHCLHAPRVLWTKEKPRY